MTLTWRNAADPVDAAELSAFEQDRGVTLPDAYKAFLMENPGGEAIAGAWLEVEGWNETTVYRWFSLNGPETSSIRRTSLGNFSREIERQFLQFAADPGGILFVLDLREGMGGKVYARDPAAPPDQPLAPNPAGFTEQDHEEAALYVAIADSFAAFIDMLGPEPDD